MKLRKTLKKCAGFTLAELLVVLVIVGILAALTIPKFTSTTTRAKATEAKLMLKQVYNLQRAYSLENDVYATTLEAIGFEQDKLKTEGGTARYLIKLDEATQTGFKAIASSVIDFDQDGTFNVWAINEKNELLQEVAD